MPDRILAFDFGLARIGVAIGNSETRTAQGLDPLSAKNGQFQETELKKLLHTWQPSVLVVGLPLNMDGSLSDMAKKAQLFAKQLVSASDLDVKFIDERLSTRDADALLQQATPAGKSLQRKRKKYRDSLAAELILRTYFDDNPS